MEPKITFKKETIEILLEDQAFGSLKYSKLRIPFLSKSPTQGQSAWGKSGPKL